MSEQAARRRPADLPLSPYQIQVSYGASRNPAAVAAALRAAPAPTGSVRSIRSTPIAPPDVAGRRFDFPAGYNLSHPAARLRADRLSELRAFADAYDLLRLVIETRKDQMERQRWRIRPRTPTLQRKKRGALDARIPIAARIVAIERFFQSPTASRAGKPGCARCSKTCS